MRRKFAASLTDECVTAVHALATRYGTNASAITEAALNHFLGLSDEVRMRLTHSAEASKKASTRTRWRSVFWHTMRAEFWLPPLPSYIRENEFAPRNYVGFQVWFLRNTLSDPEPENGPFFVETINNPLHTQRAVNVRRSFKFDRDHSPYDAAREVADYVKQQALTIGIMMISQLPDSTRIMLDFSFASWRPEKAVDLSFPITLRGDGVNYVLERDFTFRPFPMSTPSDPN
jgi:predicted transcriptional regulator